MTDLTITGVYCAAVTPVTDDLAPDHAAFVAHCRRLLDDGCDGIAMLGTTGEANSFSLDRAQGAAGGRDRRRYPRRAAAAGHRRGRAD